MRHVHVWGKDLLQVHVASNNKFFATMLTDFCTSLLMCSRLVAFAFLTCRLMANAHELFFRKRNSKGIVLNLQVCNKNL